MNPSMYDLLIDTHQQTIAADAEYRRMTTEAGLVTVPAPIRQTMGRMLISLGERVGGIHRDTLEAIAAERGKAAVLDANRLRRAA
ncbi:MAG: hypothetical protein QM589_07400 [Thermomicrobiales bacterium]